MKILRNAIFLAIVFCTCTFVGAYSYPGTGAGFQCQRMNSTGTALIYGNCLGSPFTSAPGGAGIVTQSGFNLITQSGLNIVPHP